MALLEAIKDLNRVLHCSVGFFPSPRYGAPLTKPRAVSSCGRPRLRVLHDDPQCGTIVTATWLSPVA